jgi:hypothetical protein
MALAAQGSWQYAMLHAVCPKRAFSPSRKIGLGQKRLGQTSVKLGQLRSTLVKLGQILGNVSQTPF